MSGSYENPHAPAGFRQGKPAMLENVRDKGKPPLLNADWRRQNVEWQWDDDGGHANRTRILCPTALLGYLLGQIFHFPVPTVD